MEETVDPLEHVNMDARYQEGAEPDPFTLTLIGHSHPSNTIALILTLPPEIISLILVLSGASYWRKMSEIFP